MSRRRNINYMSDYENVEDAEFVSHPENQHVVKYDSPYVTPSEYDLQSKMLMRLENRQTMHHLMKMQEHHYTMERLKYERQGRVKEWYFTMLIIFAMFMFTIAMVFK